MLYTTNLIVTEVDNPKIYMSSMDVDKDGKFVFSIDRYANEAEMYKDISSFVQLLIKNNDTCKIYADSEGVIVVEFGHDERIESWGCPVLTWLNEEEYEDVMEKRDKLNDTLFNQDTNKN